MSKPKPALYRPSTSKETNKPGWPVQAPYPSDHQPKLGDRSVGRKVKVCPVDAGNHTIFLPEWRHGDI